MPLTKEQIAQRIAQELKHNYFVNLGIGIPTLVANYIPQGIDVDFQSENGILGMGPFPLDGEEDADLINAGKQTITTLPGASFFDSALTANITGRCVWPWDWDFGSASSDPSKAVRYAMISGIRLSDRKSVV